VNPFAAVGERKSVGMYANQMPGDLNAERDERSKNMEIQAALETGIRHKRK
jgi:hypothetical protein